LPTTRANDFSRCQQLDRAEQQLAVENWRRPFALKARTSSTRRAAHARSRRPRPARAQKSYTVQGESVNIREGPSTTDPVIAKGAS
jgi:hypothetical protein